MLSEYITKLLHKIAKSENFLDYKIETKAGSNHGDNFLGVMIAVSISGIKNQNGKNVEDKLHLICKIPPSNEIRKRNCSFGFGREVYVYSKILPAFIKFQQEKGLSDAESFQSFPKVYVSEFIEENSSYILIMEDLRPKRYVMWPKEELISLDHELLILQELGKFHAISFAMKDQKPKEFEEFTQLKDASVEIIFKGKLVVLITKAIERAINAVEKPEYKKLLGNFQKDFTDKLEYLLTGSPSKQFPVIGHGDCWINNFLFQYDDVS